MKKGHINQNMGANKIDLYKFYTACFIISINSLQKDAENHKSLYNTPIIFS